MEGRGIVVPTCSDRPPPQPTKARRTRRSKPQGIAAIRNVRPSYLISPPLACFRPCGNIALLALQLFTTAFIFGVISGAALRAQTVQNPQQKLTPKEIKWPAAASTVGTSGAAGLQTAS